MESSSVYGYFPCFHQYRSYNLHMLLCNRKTMPYYNKMFENVLCLFVFIMLYFLKLSYHQLYNTYKVDYFRHQLKDYSI